MKFDKIHRREPTEPQLATMIDVFSILIIFLIAGTTMNSSILQIPAGLRMPKMTSEGATINAPQVTIFQNQVWLSINKKSYSLQTVLAQNPQDSALQELAATVKHYRDIAQSKQVSKLNSATSSLDYLNLVADATVTYNKIYPIIQYFKSLGFKSIVMVGTPKSGSTP